MTDNFRMLTEVHRRLKKGETNTLSFLMGSGKTITGDLVEIDFSNGYVELRNTPDYKSVKFMLVAMSEIEAVYMSEKK